MFGAANALGAPADPWFVFKAANVVGLYRAPPENDLVICVDEKPNIQALESTCKCDRILNLLAVLEATTGQINGKTSEPAKKPKKGFLGFLDELSLELSKIRRILCDHE